MMEVDYRGVKIIFEDNHILVIIKPVNLLSQKDKTNDLDLTEIIKEYLKNKYQKPGNVYLGLVHRLDRRVGGVMVLAKTSKAASRLSEDIREGRFTKIYLAKVQGLVKDKGAIQLKLAKDGKKQLAYVNNNGKDAMLEYQVLKRSLHETFLLVNLQTGKYNQIRVSFAHIGHSIVNDYKYQALKNGPELGLWSYKLGFIHPISKQYLEFIANPCGTIWHDLNK